MVPRVCCSLSVVVEDVSSSCCVTVKVFPFMTVAALKQQVWERRLFIMTVSFWSPFVVPWLAPPPPAPPPQVFLEYGFHPRVQRWVIGQCLCTEPRSLASYGVQKDGDAAYLYLISARQARVTRQLFQQDLESALLAPPLPPGNGPASQDWRGYSTLPSRLTHNNQGEFDTRVVTLSVAVLWPRLWDLKALTWGQGAILVSPTSIHLVRSDWLKMRDFTQSLTATFKITWHVLLLYYLSWDYIWLTF